ncbi:MAG: Macrolide export ATP-binding/permease protein MacB [Candidatus Falkowbacteria bacterium GW2011_GWC2_38_22]|uniref:Macrolide export ATP-binding/permease protein MacB n=1 Tax=Candidatus Falkowbacteria bacterium GW2011_GWE1_38_31 TaxID=1618638 RepID=A0A0G0JU25_9BACT|nr:MAG: Macrolide export ATP-binding/permease protein MacB [Candidatus Falkowbacteria bacterium GW2011_GWF2_38_1205]KKQ62158.1 MAG: Macrolide export ATP-binding/permease protein MacB [Candidatus Falkowbacteria bacterium GW2011_GWC2_38_22]KKQ64308.1 MAG: Macrolide export ATP-binding/permease protein MacB [Candidatus Falkowbacteria bacterium GW2011_GWF1_38_22]KKQ66285.1 MAG: Macrolide export ATP-binding/permease protein MacB [Candidatus Falkowbacteria bacterium GW2011_GWE2_38_254]KKQ71013.1 MAG: 
MIQLKNAHKSYFLANGDEIPVLNGIDLRIKKGEFVALMGESGCGKTTLLNIIGCLHSLSEGEYFLDNENIGKVHDDFTLAFIRNKKMGFIFQQFNLFTRLSALKNVALPALYAGVEKKARENRASELLASIGLGERVEHRPTELSGGQQQRVAIARALMNDPEIILADEPTGALDSKSGQEVMEIFMGFKNRGKTVVMVTHTTEVAKFADRIIYLRDGKVVDNDYKLKNNY